MSLTSSLVFAATTLADPMPIQCIIDVHCDPMATSVPVQAAQYEEWVEWVEWGLTEAEGLGAKISFLSTGEFMDWVLEDPTTAGDLIPRLAASGDDFIGTHSHNSAYISPHVWGPVGANPTYQDLFDHWMDHVSRVNLVIESQLGITVPEEVQAINAARGAHLPSEDDEATFRTLAEAFHFGIREQGPDEAFFALFEHFVWHPYRPSVDNLIVHDPDGPMILSPFGPVLGRVGWHHSIWQDMSAPAVQGRFTMELLNWLDEAQFGDTPHIWTTGWAAHCHDLPPGSESHDSWQPMIEWMATHFVDEQVAGMQAVEFSTMKASAALHEAWEVEYPDEVPFSYAEEGTDMDAYPWLRAPYAYLLGMHVDAAMPNLGVVRWHHLAVPDTTAECYVLWTTTGDTLTIDLSAFLTGDWTAVEPHRGHYRHIDVTQVPVRFAGTIVIPASQVVQFPWLSDLDESGSTDINDLLSLLGDWGQCADLPATCHSDLDGDGDVDIDDVLGLLSGWE